MCEHDRLLLVIDYLLLGVLPLPNDDMHDGEWFPRRIEKALSRRSNVSEHALHLMD